VSVVDDRCYPCVERLECTAQLADVAVLGCEICFCGPSLSEEGEICRQTVIRFESLEERLPQMMVRIDEARCENLAGDIYDLRIRRYRENARCVVDDLRDAIIFDKH